MYQFNKRIIKKRRNQNNSIVLKLSKRSTSVEDLVEGQISSTTSISDIFDEYENNESSSCS